MRITVFAITLIGVLCSSVSADFGPLFEPDFVQRTRVRPELSWNWGHHFSKVSIENQRVPNVLKNVLEYNFTLPRVQLQRGITYLGSACRLRRVVRDMLAGRQVRVGVIGGSVTCGTGVSKLGVADWFSIVSSYLIHAFPQSNITARNGCTPGVQSPYMIMCMDLSVDPDVDLMFVEYTLNDGQDPRLYGNRVVMNIERLLRRLLALKKHPAVVLMHNPQHHMGLYPPGHPKYSGTFVPFYETTEDAQGALSQYYDVQAISLRTALYRLAVFKGTPGFQWEEVMTDHHPGDAGHKIFADLVVYLVQEAAINLMMHPFGAVDDEVVEEPLPKWPMYEGNLPPEQPMCIMYDDFKSLVVEANGFKYVNEGSAVRPKPGFVATEPGSKLRLVVDTDRSAIGAPAGEAVHVFFHHLRSYEHMGTAEFRCTSGCKCDPVTVDAHIGERVSQLYLAELAASQSPACEITITVLPATSSGEHKFKVAGVVLSERPGNPEAINNLGGHDKAFGLLEHTGDKLQVKITKNGVEGDTRRHSRQRRRGLQRRQRHLNL